MLEFSNIVVHEHFVCNAIPSNADLENRVDALETLTSQLSSQVSDLEITTGDHETRIDTVSAEVVGWFYIS